MAETTLYNQDCIAAMQQINAESIDLIVTDPPYNLGNFMKKRDTNLIKNKFKCEYKNQSENSNKKLEQ